MVQNKRYQLKEWTKEITIEGITIEGIIIKGITIKGTK